MMIHFRDGGSVRCNLSEALAQFPNSRSQSHIGSSAPGRESSIPKQSWLTREARNAFQQRYLETSFRFKSIYREFQLSYRACSLVLQRLYDRHLKHDIQSPFSPHQRAKPSFCAYEIETQLPTIRKLSNSHVRQIWHLEGYMPVKQANVDQ